MSLRFVAAAAILAAGAPAFAQANLSMSLSQPSGVYVYETGTWTATVYNSGPKTASNLNIVIDLPITNTSPTYGVMGVLGAASLPGGTCSPVGTTLVCTLPSLKRNKSAVVSFDLMLPHAAEPLDVTATVSATTSDPNLANNSATVTASLAHYDVPIAGPQDVLNQHCTGTGLTSFFECTCFPGSISSHEITLEADGTVTIAAEPDYTGYWWQIDDQHLSVVYTYFGTVVAEFNGEGTSPTCFEGLTTFPGSAYVSPYEVCFN
jgi:hypothetical protein